MHMIAENDKQNDTLDSCMTCVWHYRFLQNDTLDSCMTCVAQGLGAEPCDSCARGEAARQAECMRCLKAGSGRLGCFNPSPIDGIPEWAKEECDAVRSLTKYYKVLSFKVLILN
jgi:hypothetical protein